MGIWGCSTFPESSQGAADTHQEENFPKIKVQDLAGVWEYEEGTVVYPLTFDANGNGIYDWKDGRFITKSLENGVWKGTWHQRDNDREGGFEMRLTKDLGLARGRWWYTRIERDQAPQEPGGIFTLRRKHVDVSRQ